MSASGPVLFMGDSITRDWGVASVVSNAINKGTGSDRTRDMAVRFSTDALAYGPSKIVLLGGLNDIFFEPYPGANEIFAMARRVLAYGGIKLLVGTVLPCSSWIGSPYITNPSAGNAAIAAYNTAIRAAAGSYYTLIDFHPQFVDNTGAQKPGLFLADGTHLTPAGYAILTAMTQTVLAAV